MTPAACGAWLPTGIDLSFASDAWQRRVRVRRRVRNRRKVQIVRRQLEVCVFTYLAHELKTGDLCVAGAEQYADYRTHLLPWSECAPQVADYCRELGFPATPGEFVAHLKEWLTQTAEEVGERLADGGGQHLDDPEPRRHLGHLVQELPAGRGLHRTRRHGSTVRDRR